MPPMSYSTKQQYYKCGRPMPSLLVVLPKINAKMMLDHSLSEGTIMVDRPEKTKPKSLSMRHANDAFQTKATCQ